MITDETIEKAALAMVNRKRCREGLEPIVSLTLAYSGATAELIRDNVRAALEAVEGDVRDVALEEAREFALRWARENRFEGIGTKKRFDVLDVRGAVKGAFNLFSADIETLKSKVTS